VDTVVQPDIFIVSDLRKVDARGVRGAPDWLAEVLSSSTARHDQFVKLPAYERAGVREVWIIQPGDLTVAIYKLEAGYYGRPNILALEGRTPITAVPGITIDWDRMVARML
jgi:Uma2 family endonuclease